MNHRIVATFIGLMAFAAIVGGVYWEWPARPAHEPSVTSTSSDESLITKATTTARQLLPAAGPSAAEGQAGVAVATPSVIAVSEATDVTVTIQITDSRLITTSVNLQRLDASGKWAVLGTLNDSGTSGDAVAADKTFSIRKGFTEATTTPVQLRVSWALKGVMQRAVSNVVVMEVWLRSFVESAGVDILHPPGTAVSAQDRRSLVDAPSRMISVVFIDSPDNPPGGVVLGVYENDPGLSVDQWFAANALAGSFEGANDIVASDTTLGDLAGRMFRSEKAAMLAVYARANGKIYSLEWPAYDLTSTREAQDFETMRASVRIN